MTTLIEEILFGETQSDEEIYDLPGDGDCSHECCQCPAICPFSYEPGEQEDAQ